jgi:ankyrin repeat protein
MPPLHLAAALGDIVAIKELIKRGVSPDHAQENHFTPLMTAAANGKSNAVEYLLEQGADPSLGDIHGNRAVYLAANLNHHETGRDG